jgi:hypothetical protein
MQILWPPIAIIVIVFCMELELSASIVCIC